MKLKKTNGYTISEITKKYPIMNIKAESHEEAGYYYYKVNNISNTVILKIVAKNTDPVTSYYEINDDKFKRVHPSRVMMILKDIP